MTIIEMFLNRQMVLKILLLIFFFASFHAEDLNSTVNVYHFFLGGVGNKELLDQTRSWTFLGASGFDEGDKSLGIHWTSVVSQSFENIWWLIFCQMNNNDYIPSPYIYSDVLVTIDTSWQKPNQREHICRCPLGHCFGIACPCLSGASTCRYICI